MTKNFLDAIIKKHGEDSVFVLGQASTLSVGAIPTGCLSLDCALGVGGVPRGRITEVYGHFQSGKTTLCQHIVAQCQQMGGQVAFIDVEHALDIEWAKRCGVDIDTLIVSQPQFGEQALDIAEMLVRSREIDLIVIDSVAALLPKAELEGELGDAHMALTARLMAQSMRRFAPAVDSSNTAVIFTNQLRKNIGATMFSPAETTTGGEALKYFASVRLDMRKGGDLKVGDEVVGHLVRITVRKNKVAPPYKAIEAEIYFDEGFSLTSELIKYGLELGIIEKGGAWFTIGDRPKVQGMDNLRRAIKADSALMQMLEDKVRLSFGLPLRRSVK